jgi:hypothetical protein
MKIYSLVYDYDIDSMKKSGRIWSEKGYKNKDYIFEYTAASIASFCVFNSHLKYDIYTDDVGLLEQKISLYNANYKNVSIIDHTMQINEWKKLEYCFWPSVLMFDSLMCKLDGFVLRLDNDLTYKSPIDKLLEHNGAIVWKFERICANGKDYWGEKSASLRTFGTANFPIYNIGTLGLSKHYQSKAYLIKDYLTKMLSNDLSDVIRFPENMSIRTPYWSCSEQTCDNFFFHTQNIPVMQSHELIDHHCYVPNKQCVLDACKHLRKN